MGPVRQVSRHHVSPGGGEAACVYAGTGPVPHSNPIMSLGTVTMFFVISALNRITLCYEQNTTTTREVIENRSMVSEPRLGEGWDLEWKSFCAVRVPLKLREDPTSKTQDWTIGKWMTTLNLAALLPSTEIDLEEWNEVVVAKIRQHNVCKDVLIDILTEDAPPTIKECLEIFRLSDDYEFEELIKVIAENLFENNSSEEEAEIRVFNRNRCNSVFEAHIQLARNVQTYTTICARRNRKNILSDRLVSDLLLRSVPLAVFEDWQRRLKQYTTLGEVAKQLKLLEAALVIQNQGILPEPQGRLTSTTRIIDGANPSQRRQGDAQMTKILHSTCWGCGERSHLRRDCPHQEDRCANCGKTGHISTVCRSTVERDSLGRIRSAVTPTQASVTATLRKDRPGLESARTVQDTVNNMVNSGEVKASKAQKRYQERRANAGKPARKLVERKVLIVEETDSDEEFENSRDYEVHHQCYSTSFGSSDHVGNRGVARGIVTINGHTANVVLNTGSEVNLMSHTEVKRLGLQVDERRATITIKG